MVSENVNEYSREKKKILLVSPFPVLRGGIQFFLLSLVKSLPREEYFFSFYCKGIADKALAEEFEAEGVRIVAEIPPEPGVGKIRGRFQSFRQLYQLCRDEKYDIIHIHTSNLRFQAEALLTAMHAGIKHRIAHGHYVPKKVKRVKVPCLQFVIRHTTDKIAACSVWAAEYMCGSKHRDDVMIFTNCIDTAHFAFCAEQRNVCRERLGLADSLILGHVGSFSEYKNHRFLIEIFHIVAGENPRARLLLVGEGELQDQIKDQVNSYGLTDQVIFAGVSNKVNEYLCAMDMFVLPSLEEGLPFVSLEAQASGLKCLVSEAVPPEARILNDFTVMSLQEGSEAWAKELLLTEPREDKERANAWQTVREAGCDIREVRRYAEELYEAD